MGPGLGVHEGIAHIQADDAQDGDDDAAEEPDGNNDARVAWNFNVAIDPLPEVVGGHEQVLSQAKSETESQCQVKGLEGEGHSIVQCQ